MSASVCVHAEEVFIWSGCVVYLVVLIASCSNMSSWNKIDAHASRPRFPQLKKHRLEQADVGTHVSH